MNLTPTNGEHVRLTIKEDTTIVENGTGTFSVQLEVLPNVNVKYFSVTQGKATRQANLQDDATILWVDATLGENAESIVISNLDGEGSDAQFESVLLGKDKDTFKVRSTMVHNASHSTSNMLTRAVMLDQSQGDYAGTIKIKPTAKGCDAYQKEETILLSEDAKMDAQPNLEISNEDVRCSHGVSVGQIDDEKLFYFQSRGITKDLAVKLIVQGFFDEIIDRMGDHAAPVKQQLLARL